MLVAEAVAAGWDVEAQFVGARRARRSAGAGAGPRAGRRRRRAGRRHRVAAAGCSPSCACRAGRADALAGAGVRRRRRPARRSRATSARSCARPRRPASTPSCCTPGSVDPFNPKVVRASAGVAVPRPGRRRPTLADVAARRAAAARHVVAPRRRRTPTPTWTGRVALVARQRGPRPARRRARRRVGRASRTPAGPRASTWRWPPPCCASKPPARRDAHRALSGHRDVGGNESVRRHSDGVSLTPCTTGVRGDFGAPGEPGAGVPTADAPLPESARGRPRTATSAKGLPMIDDIRAATRRGARAHRRRRHARRRGARSAAELLGKQGALAGSRPGSARWPRSTRRRPPARRSTRPRAAVDRGARRPPRRAGRRRARRRSSRPSASTSPSSPASPRAATPTSSPRRGSGSRTCSSASASRSPRAPRWRPTGTTSRPSTCATATRPAASSTRCSSTTPASRPARTVLRTHTSPVQIRVMLDRRSRRSTSSCPGRVFRRDTPDATHMPVFHQIEGLVVDRDITFADLAGTIEAFTKAFFGAGFTVAAAAELLPVHRAVGRVRHPARPNGDVARARRLRHGAPQRAARRRARPRGVERLRLRLRHRPHGQGAPRRRRHPRHVHQRHPLPGAVLRHEGPPLLAQRATSTSATDDPTSTRSPTR